MIFNFDKSKVSIRFRDIMNDLRYVDKRALKEIPVDLLAIDSTYQTPERTSSTAREKQIAKLAKNWDENKLEPITVVPHVEEGLFYVVNGYGRWQASQIVSPKYDYLSAMVLLGALELSPNDRRQFESELFAYQNREVAPLRALQVHGALKNLGKQEILLMEKMQKKYNFEFTTQSGSRAGGVLGSYAHTISIAKAQGEPCLDFIFKICAKSGFDRKPNGYASYLLRALRDIWLLYPDNRNEIMPYLIKMLRPINSDILRANAISKYPYLGYKMALSLYLEDQLVHDVSLDRKRQIENGRLVEMTA